MIATSIVVVDYFVPHRKESWNLEGRGFGSLAPCCSPVHMSKYLYSKEAMRPHIYDNYKGGHHGATLADLGPCPIELNLSNRPHHEIALTHY